MKRSIFVLAIVISFSAAALADEPAAEKSLALGTDKPLTCSIAKLSECDGVAACSEVALEEADMPPLWKVDFAGKQLSSADGQRSSPIGEIDTLDTVIVLQGHQNDRGWTLVVERATGHLQGSAADADGAFVLAGSCTPE